MSNRRFVLTQIIGAGIVLLLILLSAPDVCNTLFYRGGK